MQPHVWLVQHAVCRALAALCTHVEQIHLLNLCCYKCYMLMTPRQNEATATMDEQWGVTCTVPRSKRAVIFINLNGWTSQITTVHVSLAWIEHDMIIFHLSGKGITRRARAGVFSLSWWYFHVTGDLFMSLLWPTWGGAVKKVGKLAMMSIMLTFQAKTTKIFSV